MDKHCNFQKAIELLKFSWGSKLHFTSKGYAHGEWPMGSILICQKWNLR